MKSFVVNKFALSFCFFVFALTCTVKAQDVPRAVLAVDVRVDELRKSKFLKDFLDSEAKMRQLGFGKQEAEILANVNRFKALFASPKSADEDDLIETGTLIQIDFSNEATAKEIEGNLSFGFKEIERDGKSYWQAEGSGAPPIFARREQATLIFGSEEYLFAKKRNFESKTLKKLIEKQSKQPIRVAADFDGARGFVDALTVDLRKSQTALSKPYIDMLGYVRTASLTAGIDDETLLSLNVTGHDAKENEKINTTFLAITGMLKTLAGFALADLEKEEPKTAKVLKELLAGTKVSQSDSGVLLKIKRPDGLEAMLTESFQKADEARSRLEKTNKMKQLLLGMHNYYDTFRKLPFAEEYQKQSKLNCKIRMLPFLEHQKLHDQFDLDSDWDDATNRKLGARTPEIFQFGKGTTATLILPAKSPNGFSDITDGLSNTIVFIEDRRVSMYPWTKPLSLSPKEVAERVSKLKDGDSLIIGFYDGSVRRISNQTPKEVVLNLCDPSDGNPIDDDLIK